jgi:hypothetical protein
MLLLCQIGLAEQRTGRPAIGVAYSSSDVGCFVKETYIADIWTLGMEYCRRGGALCGKLEVSFGGGRCRATLFVHQQHVVAFAVVQHF